MLDNLLTVFWQVVILFGLMAFGFAGAKTKLITEIGTKTMSNILLYLVTPCLIINSFNIEFDPNKLIGLIVCFVSALLIHLGTILIVHLVFRGNSDRRLRVLRFACIFSNAGYMGLPLQQAVLGAEGVFYGAIYVAVFNIVLWTYGVICSTGDVKAVSGKKLLANPGIIGVLIGFVFFFTPLTIPDVAGSIIGSMASLNTPIAMMIIGFYLASSDILKALKDKAIYFVTFIRLIAVPLSALGIMYLCGIRDTVLVSTITAASAPVATATSLFATKFDNDIELSVNLVSFTTVLSIITMPLIVSVAQYIA